LAVMFRDLFLAAGAACCAPTSAFASLTVLHERVCRPFCNYEPEGCQKSGQGEALYLPLAREKGESTFLEWCHIIDDPIGKKVPFQPSTTSIVSVKPMPSVSNSAKTGT
jgi:hypothetical protein